MQVLDCEEVCEGWTPQEISMGLQNFMLSIEMVGFAIGHAHAFPPQEFSKPGNPRNKALGELASAWDENASGPDDHTSGQSFGEKKRFSEDVEDFIEGVNLFDIWEVCFVCNCLVEH